MSGIGYVYMYMYIQKYERGYKVCMYVCRFRNVITSQVMEGGIESTSLM